MAEYFLTSTNERTSSKYMTKLKNELLYNLILLFYYCLNHISNIFILNSFTAAAFPLVSIYISNQLLFNESINDLLSQVIISPSNAAFIYPLGIYLVTKILNTVSEIFFFLFVIQLPLTILYFQLFKSLCDNLTSLFLSLIAVYFCTSTNWWSPDWIIQPLMILSLIILLRHLTSNSNIVSLMVLGLLSGCIMLLKHNIGLFFSISCITAFFVNALSVDIPKNRNKQNFNLALLALIAAGYIGFGIIFVTKVLYFDEILYYLLPYFIFWLTLFYYIFIKQHIYFNSPLFFKNTIPYSITFAILPLAVFLWFGSKVGYGRYWHSLFGMGFNYLHIWDYGIANVVRIYLQLPEVFNIKEIVSASVSIIRSMLFLFPFVVNCIATWKVICLIKHRNIAHRNQKMFLVITSIGVVGIFMFFPLEGYHILASKLFIYIFILLILLRDTSMKLNALFKTIVAVVAVFAVLLGAVKSVSILKMDKAYGSHEIQKRFGMYLEKNIAVELDKQIGVIKRAIKNDKYYVIDSTGATLIALASMVDNRYPQYYMEMRKGILNQEVTNEIIGNLKQMPFILINYNDYLAYIKKNKDDTFMFQIIDFIHNNYEIVDMYMAPNDKKASIKQIYSFYIMQNRQYYSLSQ